MGQVTYLQLDQMRLGNLKDQIVARRGKARRRHPKPQASGQNLLHVSLYRLSRKIIEPQKTNRRVQNEAD